MGIQKKRPQRKSITGQIPLQAIPLASHRRNPLYAASSLRRAEGRLISAMQGPVSSISFSRKGKPRIIAKGIAPEANRIALVAAGRLVVARARLRLLAQLDAKFNIMNNMAFIEGVFKFLRSPKSKNPFAFATIDMDHLRKINKNHGHDYADLAIDYYIQLVSEAAKKCGGFAGRVGGDELRIFAPVGAEKLKLELNIALANLKKYGLSFSAGIVKSNSLGKRLNEQKKFEALCSLSDKAAYKSKAAGRARVTIW